MTNSRDLPPEAQGSIRSLKEGTSLPEAIQWHEGMLLSPQHFQQLSIYNEEQLGYHIAAVAPYHWGVRRLEIDPGLLLKGVLRVFELEAILSDGSIVWLPEGVPLQVDLEAHKRELQEGAVSVYLVVPGRRAGFSAVKGERSRFESIDGQSVLDENTGEGELRIPRLRPRLKLMMTESVPADYTGLPLARVKYSDNKFALVEDFVPPTFRVAASSPLGRICASVVERLWGKANFLLKVKVPSVANRAPQLLETKLYIQSLLGAVPRLHALLQTGVAHPHALYLEMCSLAGLLAVIRRHEMLPPELPAYDHVNLQATFEKARQAIFRVLDEGIMETYTDFPFQYLKELFYIEFSADWKERPLILGIKGGSDMSEKEVAAWMDQSLVASRSEIKSIEKMRILGAERKRIEGDGEVVPSRGVVLYGLNGASNFIKPGETLLIHQPRPGPRPQEIVLYVKNRPGKGTE